MSLRPGTLFGWKTQLADASVGTGSEITICHLPPGTSKWNKIEHRLLSCITLNWRCMPLTSHEFVLQAIAATTSRTGRTVQAELVSGEYPATTGCPVPLTRRPVQSCIVADCLNTGYT